MRPKPARKPKVTKAYACTNCQKVFPHNKFGKASASGCCTCPSCLGPCDRYRGTHDKVCSACKREGEWDRAVVNLSSALTAYNIVATNQNRREPKLEAILAEHVDEDRKKHPIRKK